MQKCIRIQNIINPLWSEAPHPCLVIIPKIFSALSLENRDHLCGYIKGSLCGIKGWETQPFSPLFNSHVYILFI